MDQRMPIPLPRGAQYSYSYGGEPHHGGDSLEWVIFALLLLLIALAIAQLVLTVMRRGGPRHRGFKPYGGPPGGGRAWGRPNALEVARVRYAQGAIGRDEYLQLVEDIGGEVEPPPPPPPA
jgi:uncharacterized membrane protein